MSEPTISEVLAQYPDCKEFVDAKGIIWTREDGALKSSEGLNSWQIFEVDIGWTTRMAIPGLKPRPQKRKVTVDGFIADPSGQHAVFCKGIDKRIAGQWIPCTLTYETEEPDPVKYQLEVLSVEVLSDLNGIARAYYRLKANTKYRVTFSEVYDD
jgi:hypothetical protein